MTSIVCGLLRIRIFHGQNASFIHSNPYQDRKSSISRVVPEQLESRCRNVKKLETRTNTKRRKRIVLRICGGCGKNRGVVHGKCTCFFSLRILPVPVTTLWSNWWNGWLLEFWRKASWSTVSHQNCSPSLNSTSSINVLAFLQTCPAIYGCNNFLNEPLIRRIRVSRLRPPVRFFPFLFSSWLTKLQARSKCGWKKKWYKLF